MNNRLNRILAFAVALGFILAFAVACDGKSPTSATTYDKLMVALDQPGLPVAVGHIVCLSAKGGDSRYQWTLKRGFGAITAIGTQAACFVLTTSDAYEVEVKSGDGQHASISTPVLPPLPSVCNVGTVAVLSNNQSAAEFIQRPDGIAFGWLGNYSAQDAQLGRWTILPQDLPGFTKTVSPANGDVTGCGVLVFQVTYIPVR